jgi:hypothetical protein
MLKREFLGNGVILLLRPTHNNQIKKEALRAPIIQGVNDRSWPEAEQLKGI